MNPELQAFQRSFILEVCRFAEMERKLRYMEFEMRVNEVPLREQKTDPKALPLQEMTQFEVWILELVSYMHTQGNFQIFRALAVMKTCRNVTEPN